MKKFLFTGFAGAAMMLMIFLLQGCLKDKVTRTYTILTPVYEKKDVVLANIQSKAAKAIFHYLRAL